MSRRRHPLLSIKHATGEPPLTLPFRQTPKVQRLRSIHRGSSTILLQIGAVEIC